MNEPNPENHSLEGYELITKVAKETELPTDEIMQFLYNIIRAQNLEPQKLNLEQLRSVVMTYLHKIS
jgi:hypothetical protein